MLKRWNFLKTGFYEGIKYEILTNCIVEVTEKVAKSTSAEGTNVGTELPEAPTCSHQWVIDSPAGPTSRGVCRLCDEERQFQNFIEGSAWGYDVSVEQLAGGSRFPTGSQRAQEGTAEDE